MSWATCLLNLPSMLLCCCFHWMMTKRKTCFQRSHLIKVCMLKKHVFFHRRWEYSALLMLMAAIATVVKLQSNRVWCVNGLQLLELNCSESVYLRHTLTQGKQTMPWLPTRYSNNCKQINMA